MDCVGSGWDKIFQSAVGSIIACVDGGKSINKDYIVVKL